MSGTALEAIVQLLELEVAFDQWDAAPSLYFVMEHEAGFTTHTSMLPDDTWAWGNGDPKLILRALAKGVGKFGVPPVPGLDAGRFAGVAFIAEGWGLHATSREEGDANMSYAEHNLIADHPQRVEAKFVTAVVNGKNMGAIHNRGSSAPIEGSDGSLDGDLFDAVRVFTEAMVAAL